MARPLKQSSTLVMEKKSRKAFESLIPDEWNVRRRVDPDVGIDLEVEVVEGENVTNKVFWVQLKSTEKAEHSDRVIPFSIETKYLEHFSKCRLPVVLALWVISEKQFYCLFMQKYIQEELSAKNPKWRAQKTATIEFNLDSKLENADKLNAIATEGYLYIVQQESSVRSSAGLVATWLDDIPKSNDEVLKERTLKALLCMRNEDYNGAIAEYKNILRVICKTSSTERMSILLNLGIAHSSLGQNNEALTNYGAVLELAKEINEADALAGKAAALGCIGVVYMDKGDLDNALKHLQEALKIDKEIGYRQGEANDLGCIGLIYRIRGDLDNALKYHQEALKIHREVDYRQGEANDLGNIGLIYMDKGDLDNALKHLQEALNVLDRYNLAYGRSAIQRAIESLKQRS